MSMSRYRELLDKLDEVKSWIYEMDAYPLFEPSEDLDRYNQLVELELKLEVQIEIMDLESDLDEIIFEMSGIASIEGFDANYYLCEYPFYADEYHSKMNRLNHLRNSAQEES